MVEMIRTLNVFAAYRPDGSVLYEEVLVRPIGDSQYQLVKSPGLVMGIAAEDVFELTTERKVNVVKRGGNLCLQIFHESEIDELESELTARFREIGGYLDGKASSELVYTVHVKVGFGPVEAVLRAVISKFPGATWYYGNVYDVEDEVTPLNWWRDWLSPRS